MNIPHSTFFCFNSSSFAVGCYCPHHKSSYQILTVSVTLITSVYLLLIERWPLVRLLKVNCKPYITETRHFSQKTVTRNIRLFPLYAKDGYIQKLEGHGTSYSPCIRNTIYYKSPFYLSNHFSDGIIISSY